MSINFIEYKANQADNNNYDDYQYQDWMNQNPLHFFLNAIHDHYPQLWTQYKNKNNIIFTRIN